MHPEDSPQAAENLRRWQQSGAPRRWVEARLGRWNHADWLALLEDLRRSPYWPLDPDAVGRALDEARRQRQNLRRWERSGQARAWVRARRGEWGHDDWLELLDELARSPYGPLDAEAVGEVLEEIKQEWTNLRRWQESGAPRRWLEAHEGRWAPELEPALVDDLRPTDFWPLDLEAAEEVLRQLAAECANLRRWEECGAAREWVEERRGSWGHEDWLALLDALRRSEFWPVDIEAVGRLLGRLKQEWWNLRRWRFSGLAYRWVEAHAGQWGWEDWLALRESLPESGYWPMDPVALARVLEEVRDEWSNLRRWQLSGQPRFWLEARQGQWGPEDLRSLLDSLEGSEFWPLDPRAVRQLLETLVPSAVRAA